MRVVVGIPLSIIVDVVAVIVSMKIIVVIAVAIGIVGGGLPPSVPRLSLDLARDRPLLQHVGASDELGHGHAEEAPLPLRILLLLLLLLLLPRVLPAAAGAAIAGGPPYVRASAVR